MNQTTAPTTIRIADLPALKAELHGGEFAGISTTKDGQHVAVIRLPDYGRELSHKEAMAYAAERGGKLPSKAQAALVTSNLPVDRGWYWTDEDHPDDASFAWLFFSTGGTNYYLKSAEGGALAVRLIPIVG